MPPKKVTCCICGQDVLKAQTYATGEKDEDGTPLRACKEHEGVVEKKEALQKEQQEKVKDEMERLRTPWHKRPENQSHDEQFSKAMIQAQENAQWGWEHCWCCEQPGIMMADVFKLQLVVMEKMRVFGMDWNPFDPESRKQERKIMKGLMDELGAKCVFHRFEMDAKMKENYKLWKLRINFKVRPAAEMLGIIQLCFDCQKRTGIVYDLEANMPKPNLEVLHMIGAAYEGSELQAAVKHTAEVSVADDIRRESEKN